MRIKRSILWPIHILHETVCFMNKSSRLKIACCVPLAHEHWTFVWQFAKVDQPGVLTSLKSWPAWRVDLPEELTSLDNLPASRVDQPEELTYLDNWPVWTVDLPGQLTCQDSWPAWTVYQPVQLTCLDSWPAWTVTVTCLDSWPAWTVDQPGDITIVGTNRESPLSQLSYLPLVCHLKSSHMLQCMYYIQSGQI